MNLAPTKFENTLRMFFPAMADRRYKYRVAFEARAAHAAADKNRTTSSWRAVTGDPHANLRVDRSIIAERARFLRQSTSHGTSAANALTDAVVGVGISAQCKADFVNGTDDKTQLENQRRRRMAELARADWNRDCDFEGRSQFQDFETLGFGELITAGEFFFREMLDPDFIANGRRIPLQFQMLASERLCSFGAQRNGDNEIVDGLEIDGLGRTVAYHFAENGYRHSVTRVPATEIIHPYRMDFPSQRRGLSWFAPVIPEMQQFEEIKQYALIARKVQSAIALVVSRDSENKSAPIPGLSGADPAKDANNSPMRAIEHGMIHDIGTGKVHSHIPAPSHDLDVLSKLLLRSIGIGFGISYENISGDYSDMNFAGGRMGMLQTRKRISPIHNFYVRKFERPVHDRFVRYSEMFDTDYPKAITGCNPTAVTFSKPKFDWGVNPKQEIQAAILEVAAGFATMEEVVGSKGGDWAENYDQIKKETKYEEVLDLAFKLHPAMKETPEAMPDATAPQETT